MNGFARMISRSFSITTAMRPSYKPPAAKVHTPMIYNEVQLMISKSLLVPNCVNILNLRELLQNGKAEESSPLSECMIYETILAELLGIVGDISSCRVSSLLGQNLSTILILFRLDSFQDNEQNMDVS